MVNEILIKEKTKSHKIIKMRFGTIELDDHCGTYGFVIVRDNKGKTIDVLGVNKNTKNNKYNENKLYWNDAKIWSK